MTKKHILVPCCCQCGFNEHGQEKVPDYQITYLGKIIKTLPKCGMPMLFCMYNPKMSFRDNIRSWGKRWGKINFIIWVADRESFEGEFERQLRGFPKRCPLEGVKDGS